jgi:hypothetical protein
MHAATSKLENSAQGLSCKLKFVHDLTNNMSLKPKMSSTAAAQHYRRNAEKNSRGTCTDTDLSIQLFFSQFVEAGEFLTSVGAAVLRFEFSDLLGDLKPTIKPVACTIKVLQLQ